MPRTKETSTTQVDREIVAEVRRLAEAEGVDLQDLVDGALSDLLERARHARARPHVLTAYRRSHERFSSLYEKLAS